MNNTRRDFLKNSALAATAATLGSALNATPEAHAAPQGSELPLANWPLPRTVKRGEMFYRQLGNTGDEVSIVGLGGFHIGKQEQEAASLRIIHAAIEGGITFMDNCWDYNNGASEIRMGKGLKGRRDKVFLMSKIDGRDQKTAARQIDESLLRLQTDRIDLMQFHEVIRLDDADLIFGKGGAYEAILAAKKAGKIRHIGFTGHKDPFIHQRMLDTAKRYGVRFDAVQMPINVMDAHFRSFQREIMPQLLDQKIGVLAMKTFGDHLILDHVVKSGTATPIQLLHYSMSLPVSTVVTGIDSLKVLEQALEAARTWKPMTGAQKTALLAKMRVAAAEGRLEKFKTSPRYDGTAKNPLWLGENYAPV